MDAVGDGDVDQAETAGGRNGRPWAGLGQGVEPHHSFMPPPAIPSAPVFSGLLRALPPATRDGLFRRVLDGGEVVDDPHPPAIRGDDEGVIPGMDGDVPDIARRQVAPEDVPGLAGVPADVDARVRARVEDVLHLRVLADDVDRPAGGPGGGGRTRLAGTDRIEQV